LADIFREVDEDLRAERWQKLWQRYGLHVLILAVIIVLGTVGYVLWRDRQQQKLGAAGERFAIALTMAQSGNHDGAGAELTLLSQEGAGGYPVLARLAQAMVEREAGNIDKSLAAYDAVASDKAVDAEFRALALLQSGYIRVDRDPRDAFVARMQDLLTGNSPWRFAARELIGLSHLKAGDKDGARKAFTELADDAAAPAGLRARASELLAALGNP